MAANRAAAALDTVQQSGNTRSMSMSVLRTAGLVITATLAASACGASPAPESFITGTARPCSGLVAPAPSATQSLTLKINGKVVQTATVASPWTYSFKVKPGTYEIDGRDAVPVVVTVGPRGHKVADIPAIECD